MTFRTITDPPLPAILDLWAASGAMKPIEARAAMLQAARSEAIGYYAGADLIATALLYPLPPQSPGDEPRELAFACVPEIRNHLPALIHSGRLTLARLAHIDGLRLLARVRVGHEPGRRLARLIGMAHAATERGFELWEWRADDAIRARDQIAVHRAAERG